ncbi:hypothetical protein COV17_03030 [Candidatus Woesearchaeota archaeon CG10_big_fil_rev_8_21_14_0_10_36_11]|nr:MAG: hypothetical protein COV17_03030 [Candidatus Woesearchaeota archaeon CG10_big_fil_rev_8_21_14_0_10_36_11]
MSLDYDYEGNLNVLRNMLEITDDYGRDYPIFDPSENGIDVLTVLFATRSDDSQIATPFLEIRRENEGLLSYYIDSDEDARKITPEEIAESMRNGYRMCGVPTPEILSQRLCSTMMERVGEIILKREKEKLERRLLEY